MLQVEGAGTIQDPRSTLLFTRWGVPERVGKLVEISKLVLEGIGHVDHDMMILLLGQLWDMFPNQGDCHLAVKLGIKTV